MCVRYNLRTLFATYVVVVKLDGQVPVSLVPDRFCIILTIQSIESLTCRRLPQEYLPHYVLSRRNHRLSLPQCPTYKRRHYPRSLYLRSSRRLAPHIRRKSLPDLYTLLSLLPSLHLWPTSACLVGLRPIISPVPATEHIPHLFPGPPEGYHVDYRPCIVAFHEAVGQLRVVYAQLQNAEHHMELMKLRDTALVDRTREAEKMAHQARTGAEKSKTEARKQELASEAAELRAEKSERHVFEFQESFANMNRRLKTAIGSSNKWRYGVQGVKQCGGPAEEASAHLLVLEAIISELPPAGAARDTLHVGLDDPDPPESAEAEATIADLSRQLSDATTAKAVAEEDLRKLSEHLSKAMSEAGSNLARAKQQVNDADARNIKAESHAIELQVDLDHAHRKVGDANVRTREAEVQAAEAAAKLEEAYKATSTAHSACAQAIVRAEREESERKVAQVALESMIVERGSPFIVPALMDALRVIARGSL